VVQWSSFYNFSEIYEYHGHFDSFGRSSRGLRTFGGKEGRPHSDGGFRLRSALSRNLSFSSTPLKASLDTLPCPLSKGDIGCYFLRIKVGERNWDYIGKSAESKKGISDRLREHFIKIAGTASIHHVSETKNFSRLEKILRTEFSLDPNSSEFFDTYVQLAFIKIPRNSATATEQVSKIEGMVLARYFQKSGIFPELNDRNETKGLDGFDNLIS
jgi:hypothetical protein